MEHKTKHDIWVEHFGQFRTISYCYKCNVEPINETTFECYKDYLNNIVPVCNNCYYKLISNKIVKYLKTLNIEELKFLCVMKQIYANDENDMINQLINIRFNYEEFIRNILEKGSINKLKILCKVNNLSDNGTKNDLIDRLINDYINMDRISADYINLTSIPINNLDTTDPSSIINWIIGIIKDNTDNDLCTIIIKPKEENLDKLDDGLDDDIDILNDLIAQYTY